MVLLLVAGNELDAGATTVSVGLAHRFSSLGRNVSVERLEGDDRALGDASVFASLEFAISSGRPISAEELAAAEHDEHMITIVESPMGSDAPAVAKFINSTLILVRSTHEHVVSNSSNDVPVIVNRSEQSGPNHIPEDRLLAAPTVERLIEASGANVLARSLRGDSDLCEYIVVGPISEDSNDPHFERFDRKVVVTRSERVDVALSAIRTNTTCLLLTGGNEPSPYLIDNVAADQNTTLLLASESTLETVRNIEDIFGTSPFSGPEKIERITDLMVAAVDDSAMSAMQG